MTQSEKIRRKRIRADVIERDGSICCYCDKVLTDETITVDHIVPDSKLGTYNATNLTIACVSCNQKRGNKPFFQYCQSFNWSQDKLDKYKRLYWANLQIKVLNLAKEQFMLGKKFAIPQELIKQTCHHLSIKEINFTSYQMTYHFNISFDVLSSSRDIKLDFNQLIRIIEMEAR